MMASDALVASEDAVVYREVQDQTSDQLTGFMRTTDAIFLIREFHNQVHFMTSCFLFS